MPLRYNGTARISLVVNHLDSAGNIEWQTTKDGGRYATISSDDIEAPRKATKKRSAVNLELAVVPMLPSGPSPTLATSLGWPPPTHASPRANGVSAVPLRRKPRGPAPASWAAFLSRSRPRPSGTSTRGSGARIPAAATLSPTSAVFTTPPKRRPSRRRFALWLIGCSQTITARARGAIMPIPRGPRSRSARVRIIS